MLSYLSLHFASLGRVRSSFGYLRFLSRAGEQCATVKGQWWCGNKSMRDSQIYPKSFGLAAIGQQQLFMDGISSRLSKQW